MDLDEIKNKIIFNYSRLSELAKHFLDSIKPNKAVIKYYGHIREEVLDIIDKLDKVINGQIINSFKYDNETYILLTSYRELYDELYIRFMKIIKKVSG
jgi:propanediol dehydratase small subunit